jgi:D-methionine transport system ATP-binding protein
MTVENALAYPLQLLEKSPREIKEAIGICLSNLHIPLEWLERYETQLSLGQRQLVSIARALILQPAILLLDEPTSALDMGTASYTLQVLKDLTNNRSLTVIMVNHQLDSVKGFAGEILYLESGRTSGIVPIQSINWDDLRNKLITAESQKMSGEDW